MSAIIFVLLRILMAVCLYAFIGWLIYLLWKDLKKQSSELSTLQVPGLSFEISHQGQTISNSHFHSNEVVIGRSTQSDCHLQDDKVSAFHAICQFHHGHWWLRDLSSKNGTFLNKSGIDSPVIIISNDEINCGNYSLIVQINLPDGDLPLTGSPQATFGESHEN